MSGCAEKEVAGGDKGVVRRADEQGGFGRGSQAEKMRLPAVWKAPATRLPITRASCCTCALAMLAKRRF
jgi:hypothetical protein